MASSELRREVIASAHEGTRPSAGRVLLPFLVGCALNPLNSTIISISLVLIASSYGVPLEQAFPLIAVFYVVSAIGQPIFGNLADRRGAYPLFVGGLVTAAIAGVLGAVAPSLLILVAARFLLAAGTAASYPAAIVLVRQHFERDGGSALRAIGWIAVSQQIAASLGPPIGGLLLGRFGWQAAFLLNVPVVLCALVLAELARRQGRLQEPPRTPEGTPPASLDLAGSALFALSLGALFLATSQRVAPPWTGALLVAVMAALFVAVESRVESPLVDVRLLAATPALAWIYGRFFLAGLISYSMLILWPQWLQQGRGLTVSETGLVLVPMAVLAPVAAACAGRWLDHRVSLPVAHGAMWAGTSCLLVLNDSSSTWMLVGTAAVFAIPTGLLRLGNQAAVVETAPGDRTGLSVGLLRSVWYIGAIMTSSIGSIVFSQRASTAALLQLATALFATSGFIVAVDASVALRVHRRAGRSPT